VKPFSKFRRSFVAFLCAVSAVFIGCASTTPVRTQEAGKEPVILKRIAVLPFEKLTSDDASRVARCPLGTVYTTCPSPQNADALVQELFLGKIEQSGKFSVVPPYQSDIVYQKVKGEDSRVPVLQQLQKTGKALEVDGIVVGYVSCLRERVGYAYSAERPSTAIFGIYLIRSSDGDVVWGRVFDKTQQSFSENVFQASTFFSRGMKWVTAAELAEDGVDEVLKDFPGFQ
jgi:hypothetical protein